MSNETTTTAIGHSTETVTAPTASELLALLQVGAGADDPRFSPSETAFFDQDKSASFDQK